MKPTVLSSVVFLATSLWFAGVGYSQLGPKGKGGRPPDNSAQLLAEPFKGITANGTAEPGLFKNCGMSARRFSSFLLP